MLHSSMLPDCTLPFESSPPASPVESITSTLLSFTLPQTTPNQSLPHSLKNNGGYTALVPKWESQPAGRGSLLHDNLVHLRPIFARNKQPLPPRVPGDAVQNVFLLMRLSLRNPRKFNPCRHLPRLRINPRNPIRMPNVRPDLPANKFQLIEIRDRFRSSEDLQRLRNLRRLRIDVLQPVRPIAQNQRRIIMRKSPPLSVVRECSKLPKRPQVVNESALVEPRELINLPVKNRQAFAKRLIGQFHRLHGLARLNRNFAQRRLPLPPGAFVEISIKKLKPLRERPRIMRIRLHHRRSKNRNRPSLRYRDRRRPALELKAPIGLLSSGLLWRRWLLRRPRHNQQSRRYQRKQGNGCAF